MDMARRFDTRCRRCLLREGLQFMHARRTMSTPLKPEDEAIAVVSPGVKDVDPEDDRPAVGSWWWVTSQSKDREDDRYDRPGRQWLACVVELGSNYAKIEGVRFRLRVALDDFYDSCKAEPDPDAFIRSKIDQHRGEVRRIMGKIRDLCHRLGVPMRQAIATQESAASTALAVAHSVDDVKKYQGSLLKARDKTLPELFARVKKQHEAMATWMKAELIPAQAELGAATKVTEIIEGKIHTVELYAGLQEDLAQVREGDPAAMGSRIHLMQRMHFMDEECLARYEAGGMDFKDVGQFDAWLARDGNFGRILPHERCVVAFRIRRDNKDYGDLNAFISFNFNLQNKQTFLYIRNGRQLWRMSTSVEFGESLFPRREDEDLLGDQELWIKSSELDIDHGGIITRSQRDRMVDHHRAKRNHLAQKIRQWRRAGKPDGRWQCTATSEKFDHSHKIGDRYAQSGQPHTWSVDRRCEAQEYHRLTPESIYYDDAMRRIGKAALEHNRIAVVVQGLLDRSTCLHPHPPWRIWTPEGFAAGIELVYDVSRALTPGEVPDFEEYRRQLNKGLKIGCHTIGQYAAWHEHMENIYGDKSWRHEGRHGRGPDKIHRVHRMKRDGSCEFRWERHRAKAKWIDHPEKIGYLKAVYPEIEVKWLCPAGPLTCVDAYTPGDFHMFYDDPRTRADYLQWAPILLACEDWHHARREKQDGTLTPKKPKAGTLDDDAGNDG